MKFTLPYQPSLYSKNRIYRISNKSIHLTHQVEQFISRSVIYVKSVSSGIVFSHDKIYIDIMVYRPDMRSDPANFIDVILDIVKVAINIDDRWYAGSWDWCIDKKNPRVEVSISTGK